MRNSAPRQRDRSAPAPLPWAPRAALIAALPRHQPRGRVLRIAVRLLVTAMLIAGLAWLGYAIRHKTLGDGPIARSLYQGHDSIYLPLKGYSLIMFYPTSLIWYGLVATLVLLWLAFFLADRSVVRRPHTALLRRLVGLGICRPVLVAVARLLLRGGFPPGLLVHVAEHERDLCLIALAAGERGHPRRLVALTRLLIDLTMLRPDIRSAALQAACDWQAAVLLLHVRGDPQLPKLAPQILPACARVLRIAGLGPREALATQESGFGAVSCLTDMLRLALLAGASLETLGEPSASTRDAAAARADLARALAWSAEWRRERIDRLRIQLEAALTRPLASAAGASAELFAPEAKPEELPLLGRLALSIALAAAYETRSGDQARAAVESVEALLLALGCLGSVGPPSLRDSAQRARLWLGGLPAPIDYQMAASIAVDGVASQSIVWESYLSSGTGALRHADADLAQARVSALFQAAGIARETNLLDHQHNEGP